MNSYVAMLIVDSKTADLEDPNTILVGRQSEFWGNPFPVGKNWTRSNAIMAYVKWLATGEVNGKKCFKAKRAKVLENISTLKGKTLACHCAPKRCHAEVLALVANEFCTIDQLWNRVRKHLISKTKKGA